jgi:uncharacterized SAM-binding protein YcdF (DUF218 family)
VFGAGVRPDGSPSQPLARRIDLAAELAERHPQARLFLSGAVGQNPPSEAAVMAAALGHRVDRARLILDEESRDTLQTARAAAAYARSAGLVRAIACTERYHQPRARMLLRMFGLPSAGAWFSAATAPAHRGHLWRNRLREAAALPYDVVAGAYAVSRGGWRRP